MSKNETGTGDNDDYPKGLTPEECPNCGGRVGKWSLSCKRCDK